MPTPRRPNIILTIADDQRFDLLSLLGRNACRTPALDRLAQRGTCFTRAHCMGSTHGAVCAPSRGMLHTGLSLMRVPSDIRQAYGQSRALADAAEPDPEAVPLLGEDLGRAGYHCHAVGKWHNERRSFARSFDSGAAIFFGGMSDHLAMPIQPFDPSGEYPGSARSADDHRHSTEIFCGAALDFLKTRAAGDDQPFFLYCAFTAPHDPRKTLPQWHARYPPQSIDLPPNFLPRHPFDNGELDVRDELLAGHPRTGDEARRHIADYFAMTEHLDDALGRIHRTVEEAGMADNTLIIHTADHGLAVGQHGLMGKQNLYDHSMRVPLIAAGPGFEPGRMDDRLCYQHDLFPTLHESAGLDVPASCDFTSLHTDTRRDDLYLAYREEQRAVRDDRFKLIEYLVGGERHTQLFDTQLDPWEMHNLADDPAHADRVADLRTRLRQWQSRVHDPIDVLAARA